MPRHRTTINEGKVQQMRSEQRTEYEEMELKLDIFEDILESLNHRVCDYGKVLYDCSEDELENMKWSEQLDHQRRTSEGLIISRMPYDEDSDEEWKQDQNKRYLLYAKAFSLVRTTLEKWVGK